MQRAATGLATVCAAAARQRCTAPRRPARRHRQQRRRRAVRRRRAGPPRRPGRALSCSTPTGRTPPGSPRCARPAAGCSSTATARRAVGRADLVARRDARHRRPRRAARRRGRSSPAVAAESRGARRRRRRPQRRRRRHRRGRRAPPFPADVTVTFGALKAGLVVGDGRGLRRRGRPGRHRPRPAPARPTAVPAHRRRRRRAAAAAVGRRRQVHAGRGRRRRRLGAPTPAPRVLCTGAALRTRPGLVRYAGTAADGVRAAWPEAIVTDGRPGDAGRVQAWVVGPGWAPTTTPAACWPRCSATDLPVVVDADALTMLAARAGPGPRPDRADPAHPARPASSPGFGAERAAPSRIGAATPAAPPSSAPSCCSRATPRSSPDPTARRSSTRPAPRGWPPPAPATCSPGSPARCSPPGWTPLDAGAVGAYLHGRAGQLAAERGPLIAGDLVRRLPEAIGRVRGRPGAPPGTLGDVSAPAADPSPRRRSSSTSTRSRANTAVLRERRRPRR